MHRQHKKKKLTYTKRKNNKKKINLLSASNISWYKTFGILFNILKRKAMHTAFFVGPSQIQKCTLFRKKKGGVGDEKSAVPHHKKS